MRGKTARRCGWEVTFHVQRLSYITWDHSRGGEWTWLRAKWTNSNMLSNTTNSLSMICRDLNGMIFFASCSVRTICAYYVKVPLQLNDLLLFTNIIPINGSSGNWCENSTVLSDCMFPLVLTIWLCQPHPRNQVWVCCRLPLWPVYSNCRTWASCHWMVERNLVRSSENYLKSVVSRSKIVTGSSKVGVFLIAPRSS